MNKYERLKNDLELTGRGKMKAFGNSMLPKTDAHKGFLIANNHGFENGWTRTIYGKVVVGEFQNQIIYKAG